MRRVLLVLLGAALLAGVGVVAVRSAVGDAPSRVDGLAAGPRGGCPPSPNCVSSLATDPAWAVEPLRCAADGDAALAAVDTALGGRAVALAPGRWVVRTPLLMFPDDVVVAAAGGDRLDVLSASRVGSDDLGTNRDRVAALRDALATAASC